MTDRVSSIEDSWSENEEYDNSYTPTPEQREMALKELEDYQVTNLSQIGEGAYGFVFKGSYQGSYAVIKVSLYEHTKNILKQSPKMQRLLLTNLQRRNSRKSDSLLRAQKNEQQFFTEDHVIRSKHHPDIVYHVMEFLPGTDLQVYLEEKAKKEAADPNEVKLTYTDLMKIFCSLLHAMKFFHEAGIIFNDLKLENVIIDPKYKRVTIIDYIDSSTGCSKLKCNEDKNAHIVNTLVDHHNNKPCIADDIWRVALTILDCIHLYITGTMDNIPGSDIDRIITPYAYPMDDIMVIVNNEMNALRERFQLDEPAVEALRETLLDMLDPTPSKRPDINELLQQPPFDVCLKDRKYLMPKMLQSRRLAKEVAKQLSEHLGETPIVVPKIATPPTPPTAPTTHPAHPFQRPIPTPPTTPTQKRKRSVPSTHKTHKEMRKRTTTFTHTQKRKRSSIPSTGLKKKRKRSASSTQKKKRKRSSSPSAAHKTRS